MTVGNSALKALIEQGDTDALRDLTPGLFTPTEAPAYEFLMTYYRKHGRLPGLDVMAENGFRLPKAATSGAMDYYLDRLRDRSLWQDISPDVGALSSATANKDIELMRQIVQRMNVKARDRERGTLVTNIGREAQDVLNEVRSRADISPAIPFGWPALDHATGGMRESELIVLAGRTNVGKSYLLLYLVMEAWRAMFRPLVITMEMGVRQLATRLVGVESGLNPRFIRDKQLSTRAEAILAETVLNFQLRPPMTFVSGHKLGSVEDVESIIRETNPDCVYIDAAYLLKLANNGRKGRWEVLEEVMEALQSICVRTRRPMVITVQLGRGQSSKSSSLEGSIDKIRGSDAIAQLGSVVVGVAPASGVWAQTRRIMRLIKNREGPKEIEWWTKFEFNPMDFSETVSEAEEQRRSNVRGMM